MLSSTFISGWCFSLHYINILTTSCSQTAQINSQLTKQPWQVRKGCMISPWEFICSNSQGDPTLPPRVCAEEGNERGTFQQGGMAGGRGGGNIHFFPVRKHGWSSRRGLTRVCEKLETTRWKKEKSMVGLAKQMSLLDAAAGRMRGDDEMNEKAHSWESNSLFPGLD